MNAHKSLVNETCDLYNSGIIKLDDISNMLGISKCTVRNYLKIGTQYGWCNYNAEEVIKEKIKRISIPIVLTDDFNNIIYSFDSMRHCARKIKEMYGVVLDRDGIKHSCQTHKPYKGFNFRFANETIQN